MAQEVYMAEQVGTRDPDGKISGLNADTTRFRHRGGPEAADDDPHGYRRMMHKRGHGVVIFNAVVGTPEPSGTGGATVHVANAYELELSVTDGVIDPF